MQSNYQILLSPDVWADFTDRLSRVSRESPSGIDAFLAAFSTNISIYKEGRDTIIESSNIDEDSIVTALTQNIPHNNSIETIQDPSQTQERYQIHISNSIDMTSFVYEANRNADIDAYQVHSITTPHNPLKFYSTDTQHYLKSA